ncbi:MAG: hypothetical protein HRU20_03980 [Pseudomonadales bacterium]|nr:hypothetical protein [Pseudomonadales bacterium]
MKKNSILLSTLILSAASTAAYAEDYYVSDAKGIDNIASNDCLTWDEACKTIGYAVDIEAVKKGDVIHIAGGVYYPATITPTVNLTFIGGYEEGKATPNPDKFPTVLSGDVDGNDETGTHAHVQDPALECKVAGITTDHSCIMGTNTFRAFLVDNHDIKLKNLTLTAFKGTDDSNGTVFAAHVGDGKDYTIALDNVDLIGNSSLSMGVVSLRDVWGESGGTLDVTIKNALIKGNRGDGGGAITVAYSGVSLTVEDSEFLNNDAINEGTTGKSWNDIGHGGAIFHENGTLLVKRSLFQGNTAVFTGAGISAEGGGAIFTQSKASIVNSTFVGNESASSGGAIYVKGGEADISYSTFYDNTAVANGGGIVVNGGTMSLQASLILGNTGTGANIHTASGFTDLGHNLIGANNNSAAVVGTWDKGEGSYTSVNTIENIIETTLSDNGGPMRSIKLKINSEARNAILNDGIQSLGQGQSDGYPFPTIAMATGSVKSLETYAKGTYYFDLNGGFSTTVDDEGNVLVPDANKVAILAEPNVTTFEKVNSGGETETWATGRGNCNGSITILDGRGLPRSDYANPNDENQYGDVNDCDIGAFEFNDGYRFDCYTEDGDRPGLPVIDLATGNVDFTRVSCLGGNLGDLTPQSFLDNFGAVNFYWISLLVLLGLYRRKV